jgi:SAM-dependent methyltransferase
MEMTMQSQVIKLFMAAKNPASAKDVPARVQSMNHHDTGGRLLPQPFLLSPRPGIGIMPRMKKNPNPKRGDGRDSRPQQKRSSTPPFRRQPERPRQPDRVERPDSALPRIEPTTLWDFPAQNYGGRRQGDTAYTGATPSYIIWNLLLRYTQPDELVVDPMAGSGTTLDVARELGRRALGYDVNPTRQDIFRVDSRKLPLESGKASFVFVDPPYSTHVEYSDDPRCIGKLDAAGTEYYAAMEMVIGEIHRVLAPGRHMALYVSDSFVKGKGFHPIGFELFSLMRKLFTPVDIVSVVRHNKTLTMGNYRKAAEEGGFFLRGFNYLFIMQKPERDPARRTARKPAPAQPPRPGRRRK